MPRYKHYSYEQGKFIPIHFEAQILPGTFEHALNHIVDHELDMSVFETRYRNEETGAPAYDPKILLKIVLYAYSRGIFTSRDIESMCQQNVMFMALAADTRPHFTTIAEFISAMGEVIKPLFRDVVMYCDELGLIGKEMFAIDGCKITSNASKEWSGTREDFEKKVKKYEELIEKILSKHREADEREEQEEQREKEAKAVEGMKKKVEKIKGWLAEYEEKRGKSKKELKQSMTDKESGKMPSSHGVIQGYNGIVAVDGKHQVIVHAEANGEGPEQGMLEKMVKGVEETFEEMGEEKIYEKAKVLADSGFQSEENMKMLEERGIDGYIPDRGFRKRDERFEGAKEKHKRIEEYQGKVQEKKGLFQPKDFVFNPETGKLECPAGKPLYRQGKITTRNGYSGYGYHARITDCRGCPLRAKCLRNPETPARQVYKFYERNGGQSYTKRMIEKLETPTGRFLYSLRMGIVEPVFAHIRYALGLDRFTLRGKKKVDAQWKLYGMVHNILKAYRYGWQAAGSG